MILQKFNLSNTTLMNSTVSARLNADLLDEKYAQWSDDPRSVDAEWAAFFDGFELGSAQTKKEKELTVVSTTWSWTSWLSRLAGFCASAPIYHRC
jgi:2-oxoglutarate dehydrogenase complex dehydrogenase (E1) component-like enzyme